MTAGTMTTGTGATDPSLNNLFLLHPHPVQHLCTRVLVCLLSVLVPVFTLRFQMNLDASSKPRAAGKQRRDGRTHEVRSRRKMGRVKLMHETAKVDEPMAEIAGGKRDKPALQTQQHAAPREASSVVPCRAVCRLCRASASPGGHTKPRCRCRAAPSCRLFDTSMGHNHEEAQSRITSSSAASSNARCSGKRAAQQHSRHSRIVFRRQGTGPVVRRHAASCGAG